MLVLADRNFASGKLIAAIAATEADVLVRVKTGRGAPKLPVLCRQRDGSYQSMFGGQLVRVINAEISIATKAGRRTGTYRPVTTLLDSRRYPAFELIRLYHERWEIETAYLELKSSILGGRVLRARTPAGVEQEVYALLVTYQILRTAMADATATRPGRRTGHTGWHAARHVSVRSVGGRFFLLSTQQLHRHGCWVDSCWVAGGGCWPAAANRGADLLESVGYHCRCWTPLDQQRWRPVG
jgi:hypothetical protein